MVDIICRQAHCVHLLCQLNKAVCKADRADVARTAHRNVVARRAGSGQFCRMLCAHDERARLGVIFGLAGFNVHDVNFRTHDLIEQQVRAHILLVRLYNRR